MSREKLTEPQRAVFLFVREHLDQYGYPPTLKDVCTHFGWTSTNAAAHHLNSLIRKGLLRRETKRARALTIVEGGS